MSSDDTKTQKTSVHIFVNEIEIHMRVSPMNRYHVKALQLEFRRETQ